MKQRLIAMSLAAAALLSGCSYAIPRWTPGPQATPQNFKQDDYTCIRETASRSAGGTGLAGASMIRRANNESLRLYTMCMELKGWVQSEQGGVESGWRPF
jgi:hypothetical protein